MGTLKMITKFIKMDPKWIRLRKYLIYYYTNLDY
jgi:hypothetical protein